MRFRRGEEVATTIYYNNETGKRQQRDIAIFFGTYDSETGEFTYDHRSILGYDRPFKMTRDKSYTTGAWYIPIWMSGTFDIMLALGQYKPDTEEFEINENETYIREDYIEIYP